MALTNFSLPFGSISQPVHHWGATASPLHQLASNTNNLLYSPADHQQQDDGAPPPVSDRDYYKNNPYAPPQLHHQQQQQQQQQQYNQYNNNGRRKAGNTYLPPIPPPGARNTQYHQPQQSPQQQQQTQQQQQQQQYSHYNTQQQQQQLKNTNVASYKATNTATVAASSSSRTYGEGSYNHFPAAPSSASSSLPNISNQQQPNKQYGFNTYSQTRTATAAVSSSFNTQQQQQQQKTVKQTTQNFGDSNIEPPPQTAYGAAPVDNVGGNVGNDIDNGDYPHRPPGFTRVQAGQGTRTQVHAVLDYDVEEGEEDYYDENDHGEEVNKDESKKSSMPTVTPIQGPIYIKNGTVPVVPLLSYPTINNGSFVQIPIWWTALSVALGLDVRGDIIKGVPCVKRYHQLFCPTAGNSYPIEKIERFIDDNKALMRRMYGDFEMNLETGGPRQQTKKRRRRFIDEPDISLPPGVYPSLVPDDDDDTVEAGDTYFGKLRNKRQAGNQNRNSNRGQQSSGPRNTGPGGNAGSSTGRLDSCESKVEIVTPYWASNSAGKIRAIVNTMHFEQAVHQEICSKAQTTRCDNDCGCEQKYKWHRLLAYDPDNDCKGIFMDWFLFPSCCVCRCNP